MLLGRIHFLEWCEIKSRFTAIGFRLLFKMCH